MPRLFVGIDLPEAAKAGLSVLCTGLPAARWVDPPKLHLTLRFIGEVDEAAVASISEALMRIEAPRFVLALVGVGHFRRCTVWVGVEENCSLLYLQAEIEAALRQIGLAPERQKYVPHVKLARLRSSKGLRPFLDANASFRAEPFEVRQFSLIESHLGKSGTSYEHRADYPLW
jgi:2'-5' RNA ligase